MSKLHNFLVEHAKFPFPRPDELRTPGTTNISDFEVGLLVEQWKANRAVRDNTLVQKLCDTFENIVGDIVLTARAQDKLMASFDPELRGDEFGRDRDWFRNASEAHSRSLLDKGCFVAARKCIGYCGGYEFGTAKENLVEHGTSKVDYIALVDDEPRALCEAKSPSVMKKAGDLLPPHGIELTWTQGQPLVAKILATAALYLGLRQMEWLFLTCHNYWIVCRLVKDDNHPYLAYSPKISIEDSSEPFRAFLGSILSVVRDVPVAESTYSSDMQLDTIEEEDDEDQDSSGLYRHSLGGATATGRPTTRSQTRNERQNTESDLIVTSSSPKSPEYFQVWVHLYTMSNNTLVLPECNGNGKRRLWLTRFIRSGSTGTVWQCRFDNSGDSFAVKIVEVLRRSDTDRRKRLRNEFDTYLTLDEAYQSGKLCDRIAPRCYGAFEGNRVDLLILDLYDGSLNDWDELSPSEQSQLYKLVEDLHSIGIVHKDLEPRNVVRTHGGGFHLIDFSESRKHICKESKLGNPHTPGQKRKCSELKSMRNFLWKRPLQADRVNLG